MKFHVDDDDLILVAAAFVCHWSVWPSDLIGIEGIFVVINKGKASKMDRMHVVSAYDRCLYHPMDCGLFAVAENVCLHASALVQ